MEKAIWNPLTRKLFLKRITLCIYHYNELEIKGVVVSPKTQGLKIFRVIEIKVAAVNE